MMGRRPVFSGRPGARATLDGRAVLMFGSNDYLGLAGDPRVAAAMAKAAAEYGGGLGLNPPLATTDIHLALEAAVAAFHGMEDAVLFASCTAANLGLLDGLVGRGDLIFSDELNHASIIDGCRLSRAETVRLPHRDMAALGKALAARRGEGARALYIADGVFSMEGWTAPLAEILRLCRAADTLVALDESHAAGVIGATGRGTVEHEAAGPVDLVTGTFSKAFGCVGGGYIAASRALIEELRRRARMAQFTTTLNPASAAGALAALTIAGDEPERRRRLAANLARAKAGLRALGFAVRACGGAPPVIMVGEEEKARALAAALRAAGLYIPALTFPIVPKGEARLRMQPSAAHAPADVDAALDILGREARALGLRS
jgi:glycine C-acetyltransferase